MRKLGEHKKIKKVSTVNTVKAPEFRLFLENAFF